MGCIYVCSLCTQQTPLPVCRLYALIYRSRTNSLFILKQPISFINNQNEVIIGVGWVLASVLSCSQRRLDCGRVCRSGPERGWVENAQSSYDNEPCFSYGSLCLLFTKQRGMDGLTCRRTQGKNALLIPPPLLILYSTAGILQGPRFAEWYYD